MSRKRLSPNNQPKNKDVRRSRQPKGASLSYRYRLLAIVCGMCLIIGFFVAARQHFSSIDLSIKNSRLRKMSDELESDKRRLLLTKEIALSPSEIKKAAQKIGFKAMTAAANIPIFNSVAVKTEKPRAEKSSAAQTKPTAVVKTIEPAAVEKTPAKKIREEKPAELKIKKDAVQTAR